MPSIFTESKGGELDLSLSTNHFSWARGGMFYVVVVALKLIRNIIKNKAHIISSEGSSWEWIPICLWPDGPVIP